MENSLRNAPDEIVVFDSDSILTVLKRMDVSLKRLFIVLNSAGHYQGLISMGDIQRAIIRNEPLDQNVSSIMRKQNTVAHISDPFSEVKTKMIQFRMEFMPVLNDKNTLAGVFLWEDIFKENAIAPKVAIDLPVVIMAGGKGSRLKPITNILPKPLIPIGDKSIMEVIMESFVEYQCKKFYISVNYKADFIQNFVDTYINHDNRLDIKYFREDKPLGTAGSLYLLKGQIQSPFFISNCDIIIEQDYNAIWEFHKRNNNELTIVAVLKHNKIPYGTVVTGESGQLISLEEKPEITYKINSGLYLLENHLLDEIPDNEFFHITELIEKILSRGGKVGVFPVPEGAWKDIGEWDEYLKNFKN